MKQGRKPFVKFSVEWDKLKHPRFSTIRSWDARKEEWYRSLIGHTVTMLKVQEGRPWAWSGRRKLGEATLLDVEVVVPRSLPSHIIETDILRNGKPDEAWRTKLLAMDKALMLTFERHSGLYAGEEA